MNGDVTPACKCSAVSGAHGVVPSTTTPSAPAAAAVGATCSSPLVCPAQPASAATSYALPMLGDDDDDDDNNNDGVATASLDEEEMDMFDIELQREFQSGTVRGMAAATAATATNVAGTSRSAGVGGVVPRLELAPLPPQLQSQHSTAGYGCCGTAAGCVASSSSRSAGGGGGVMVSHASGVVCGGGVCCAGGAHVCVGGTVLGHARSHAPPCGGNAMCCCSSSGGGSGSGGVVTPPLLFASATTPPEHAAAATTQFASMASAWQISSMMQDKEMCVRLVHHLASELRRELQLTTTYTTTTATTATSSGGVGGAAASTASGSGSRCCSARGNNGNHSAWVSGAAGDSACVTPTTYACAPATSFDEDRKLLTMFLYEVSQNSHTMWRTPCSPSLVGAAAAGGGGAAATTTAAAAAAAATATATAAAAPAAAGGACNGACYGTDGAGVTALASARTHASSTSPTSMPHAAAATAAMPSSRGGYAGAQRPSSSSCGTRHSTGRCTIDTEVTDSLGRLPTASGVATAGVPLTRAPLLAGGGGGCHHHRYVSGASTHEYDVRPANPCYGMSQGCTGGYGVTPHPLTQPQCLSQYVLTHNHVAHRLMCGCAGNNGGGYGVHGGAPLSSTGTAPADYGASLSSTTPSPSTTPAAATAAATLTGATVTMTAASAHRNCGSGTTLLRRNARSGGGSAVAHPRAVKPQPAGYAGRGGRSRGPRSQTGKNVSPSNHSAFSECSGGETRSYQSTVTAFPLNASSTAATTNTSLSSTTVHARPSSATVAAAVAASSVVLSPGSTDDGSVAGVGDGNVSSMTGVASGAVASGAM